MTAIVNDIIAFESGELSDLQTLELFAHLIRTGQAWSLQGTYGRTAAAMIENGLVTSEGTITDAAYDLLADAPEDEDGEVETVLKTVLSHPCRECREVEAEEWGMCGSCIHDAMRSGWIPGE